MTEVLTGVLVVITGYYAWQNQRMVLEMRKARELSVRPHLRLDLERLGGVSAALTVTNVGLGPALDVEVTLAFVPRRSGPEEVRVWRPPVLVRGQGQRFAIPAEGLDMNAFAASYHEVLLTGKLNDTLGQRHQVDDAIRDIQERWTQTKEAKRLFSDSPLEKATKEIAKPLKEIGQPLQRIAAKLQPPPPPDSPPPMTETKPQA